MIQCVQGALHPISEREKRALNASSCRLLAWCLVYKSSEAGLAGLLQKNPSVRTPAEHRMAPSFLFKFAHVSLGSTTLSCLSIGSPSTLSEPLGDHTLLLSSIRSQTFVVATRLASTGEFSTDGPSLLAIKLAMIWNSPFVYLPQGSSGEPSPRVDASITSN